MPEGFNKKERKMNKQKLKNTPLEGEMLLGGDAISYVYKTWDYGIFTTFKENREPDHVGRIANNMVEYGAIDKPIVCTVHPDYPGKLVIVDGNNSRFARIQLGLPIFYVILKGATPNDMTALNLVSRNWTNRNYVDFYASLGYQDYLIFQSLLNEYEFTCKSMEYILRLSTTEDKSIEKSRNNHHSIARGVFKIRDIARSREIIDFLLEIKRIGGEASYVYKADKFVAAVVRLFRLPEFDPERALSKLKINSGMIQKQTDANSYINMIQEIYNRYAVEKDRIWFSSARFK